MAPTRSSIAGRRINIGAFPIGVDVDEIASKPRQPRATTSKSSA